MPTRESGIGNRGSRIGLYVHCPFCLSKCAYCDFDSLPLEEAGGLPQARRYLDALAVELDLRAASEEFAGARVDTIFLGGGTPTVLPAEWLADLLARIRRRFAVDEDAEITVEANPGTVNVEKLRALRDAGANRLSLGAQSFSDESLRLLGRVHTASQAREAVAAAREAGFDNLSLDLIYGLPGQSTQEWQADVTAALALAPEHISAYGLSLEPGTRLAEQVGGGRLPEPDEEAFAEMYRRAEERLNEAGYQHYEISNYALPGQECRHNRKYWAGDEYLGLGSSAHSYQRGIRWNNLPSPQVYSEWLECGRRPVERAEALSARDRVGELLMLGLRRAEGVSEAGVTARLGVPPREVFGATIARLCEEGRLIAEDGRLRLPREQWLISNEVLAEFVMSS